MSLILMSVTSSKGCEVSPVWKGVAMVGVVISMVLGVIGPIIFWALTN